MWQQKKDATAIPNATYLLFSLLLQKPFFVNKEVSACAKINYH